MSPAVYFVFAIILIIFVALLGFKIYKCKDDDISCSYIRIDKSQAKIFFWICVIVLIAVIVYFFYDYNNELKEAKNGNSSCETKTCRSEQPSVENVYSRLACAKTNVDKLKILNANRDLVNCSNSLQNLQYSLISSLNDIEF